MDGRNIWKNDFESSLQFIRKAKEQLGEERILIAPSSSLLHVPYDLDLETKEESLPAEIKQWMAYAKQKIKEVALLRDLSSENPSAESLVAFGENKKAIENKKNFDADSRCESATANGCFGCCTGIPPICLCAT